jgi:hypothetical protein
MYETKYCSDNDMHGQDVQHPARFDHFSVSDVSWLVFLSIEALHATAYVRDNILIK